MNADLLAPLDLAFWNIESALIHPMHLGALGVFSARSPAAGAHAADLLAARAAAVPGLRMRIRDVWQPLSARPSLSSLRRPLAAALGSALSRPFGSALRGPLTRPCACPLAFGGAERETDPGFDPLNHVRLHTPATDFHAAAGRLMGRPLERTRPPWEAHVLPGEDGVSFAVLFGELPATAPHRAPPPTTGRYGFGAAARRSVKSPVRQRARPERRHGRPGTATAMTVTEDGPRATDTMVHGDTGAHEDVVAHGPGIDPERLALCLDVLAELDTLDVDHPDAIKVRRATSHIYRTVKQRRRQERRAAKTAHDKAVTEATATGSAERIDDETEGILPSSRTEEGTIAGILQRPRSCYICKQRYVEVDYFYHSSTRSAPTRTAAAGTPAPT
ncbi:hypothetical protein SHIRM173S_12521 [Streptomyces hirsutus]